MTLLPDDLTLRTEHEQQLRETFRQNVEPRVVPSIKSDGQRLLFQDIIASWCMVDSTQLRKMYSDNINATTGLSEDVRKHMLNFVEVTLNTLDTSYNRNLQMLEPERPTNGAGYRRRRI